MPRRCEVRVHPVAWSQHISLRVALLTAVSIAPPRQLEGHVLEPRPPPTWPAPMPAAANANATTANAASATAANAAAFDADATFDVDDAAALIDGGFINAWRGPSWLAAVGIGPVVFAAERGAGAGKDHRQLWDPTVMPPGAGSSLRTSEPFRLRRGLPANNSSANTMAGDKRPPAAVTATSTTMAPPPPRRGPPGATREKARDGEVAAAKVPVEVGGPG
jgi:hypothetical protein